jgi:D-alanyl-D-alanine dipeptidase
VWRRETRRGDPPSGVIHRVGHDIGLTTHEPPYMVDRETHLIEPGMCFSIEPSIEDIVVVAEDGGRRPNNTSHELRIAA